MPTAAPGDAYAELEALLSEPPDSAHTRAVAAGSRLPASHEQPLVIFGAGVVGRVAVARLRSVGVEPLAFTDNNPSLWGKTVEGLEVLRPDEAAQRHSANAEFVVAVTMWGERDPFGAIQRELRDMGCRDVVSTAALFWHDPDAFIPFGALDYPDKVLAEADAIRECFKLWSDEASRCEYLTQLRLRLLLPVTANDALPPSDVYFPGDLFGLGSDEVFVDCGAFDGDVIREYMARQGGDPGRIIAIEPDPASFAALRTYVDSLPPAARARITTLPLAVSDRRGQLQFAATGSVGSAVTPAGSVTVDAAPLDELLAGEAPAFIKMDLEGAEPAALRGTRSTIAASKPILAICVYHEQDHLWRLPLQVASYADGYRYFLRSYGVNGIDTICYAIPPERLLAGTPGPEVCA